MNVVDSTAVAYLAVVPYSSARAPLLRFMREFGAMWWRTLSSQADGTRAWPTIKTRTPEFAARMRTMAAICGVV